MADKVELNVDENQAICLSKIDFMQKYPPKHVQKKAPRSMQQFCHRTLRAV